MPLLAPATTPTGPTPEQIAKIVHYNERVKSAVASALSNASLLNKALDEAGLLPGDETS